MAKANSTPQLTRGQKAATPDPATEQRLRRWACRVVSDLPHGAEAQRVLDLAGELLRGWASRKGRTAR